MLPSREGVSRPVGSLDRLRCAAVKRGVFGNPGYRWLFAAAAVSNYGSMLNAIALPFVAVMLLDAGPAEIATLTAAGLVPGFALGLVASAWVDRLPRRRVLVASDWARALLLTWVPVAAALDVLTLRQLYGVVFFHGLLTFLFGAAHHAILPAVVRPNQLLEANGRLKAAEAVTEGVAFASGGWLVEWIGPARVLLVDAVSYVVSAVLLGGVPERPAPPVRGDDAGVSRPEPGEAAAEAESEMQAAAAREGGGAAPPARGLVAEVRAGIRFLRGHPLLLPGTVALALAAASWRIAGVVYLLYVYEELGFSPGTLGLVFAVGGVASLAGAVAAERVSPRLGVGRSLTIGLAGFSLATLPLPLAPGAGAFGLALLVAHQLGDGFEILFEVNHSSLRQSLTPGPLLGRVVGAGGVAAAGAMLLGLALGALLGEWLGLRATLVASGCVGLAATAVVALSPLGRLRELPGRAG